MPTLFGEEVAQREQEARPLADRMRPREFDDFVGQDEAVGEGTPLRRLIEEDRLQSLILWGPPGSGKTTLAHIIAQKTKGVFQTFSPVLAGVPELRRVISEADQRLKVQGKRTVLFVDEIHRFNKGQQDAFLPHVEKGTIILIGATTQNPSFDLIAPLLSRSLVVVLKPLSDKAMETILLRALRNPEDGYGKLNIALADDALKLLENFANGDARVGLNALEFLTESLIKGKPIKKAITITKAEVDNALKKKVLRYDRAGEEHYNTISAFIKSMRDSDPDGALYWLARMVEAGENPRFIARRMLIFASEDVGNADPHGIVVASAVAYAVEHVGMPEAQINLAQGATYLATAPKDNASYQGILEARKDASEFGNLPVPLHLRNAVTQLMRELEYGKGYKYAHDFPEGKVGQEHLPKELKEKRYYKPKRKPS